MHNAISHDNDLREVSLQALQNAVTVAHQVQQNAVETANMVGKQAHRHSDLAIDRQWNVDEVSTLTAKSGAQADAFVTTLAVAIAQALQQAGVKA